MQRFIKQFANSLTRCSQTLKASRTFPGLDYRFYIVPKHLHHFRHIILDKADQEAKISLVASLNSFINLRELTLENDSANDTFGDAIAYHQFVCGPVVAMLRHRGKDIRILHLLDFDLRSARVLRYVTMFPNLRQLSINGSLQIQADHLSTLVQSLPHLEELTVDNHAESEATFPSEFSSATWPRIKKLNLVVNNIQTATIDFIRNFESSLLRFCLTVPGGNDYIEPEPASMPSDAHFPRLQSIAIVGASQIAWSMFENLTKTTFPSLVKVRLSHTDAARYGFGEEDQVLHKILDNSTIRVLQYFPADQDVQVGHQHYLESKAGISGFRLQLYDCQEGTFPTLRVLDDPLGCVEQAEDEYHLPSYTAKCDLEPLRAQVQRVQNHLDDSVKAAELTGNLVEYQRILNLAGPLEYDRLAKME